MPLHLLHALEHLALRFDISEKILHVLQGGDSCTPNTRQMLRAKHPILPGARMPQGSIYRPLGRRGRIPQWD